MRTNSLLTDCHFIVFLRCALWRRCGARNWGPLQSRLEVIGGADLTQTTSWRNVELALKSLRRARVLSNAGIHSLSLAELEKLVRPSGFFRQKARRLKI